MSKLEKKPPYLTDAACRNATCTTTAVRKMSDGLNGLYLWVYAGGRKTWMYRYSVHKDGRLVEKSLTLGRYPDLGLAAARVEAAKAALLGDPAAARKAVAQAKAMVASNTFEALAREWHRIHSPHWSTKYGEDVLKRLKADAFPAIGQRPVAELKASEIVAVLLPVQARGNVELAYRLLGHITQVLDFAIAKDLVDSNVAQGREKALAPAPHASHAHVEPHQLPALLRAIDGYSGSPIVRLALRILPRVFTRATELLGATWGEFDLAKAEWEIPASRMKMRRAHLVPLAPQVVKMLEELKALGHGSPWVFPGKSVDKPLTSKALLQALASLGYGGVQTSHGWRHVASTALYEARNGDERMFDEDAIERQLAHVQGGVRGRYDKSKFLAERRRMMLWYADHLDELARK
ncbi:tyrosine-type recombinase/integrase [Pseudomonas sp.]|uniref:tyrosine-type recombinase/integrase n=1 Tax=Pseudomonas sp. TaxID=306 RepID=UPI002FCA8DF4